MVRFSTATRAQRRHGTLNVMAFEAQYIDHHAPSSHTAPVNRHYSGFGSPGRQRCGKVRRWQMTEDGRQLSIASSYFSSSLQHLSPPPLPLLTSSSLPPAISQPDNSYPHSTFGRFCYISSRAALSAGGRSLSITGTRCHCHRGCQKGVKTTKALCMQL